MCQKYGRIVEFKAGSSFQDEYVEIEVDRLATDTHQEENRYV
jgi:hypothetical protein